MKSDIQLANLVTKAYLDNSESSMPVRSLHQILNCKDGLICLAGGLNGIITKNFEENSDFSDQLIKLLKDNFLDNFFFLEIQRYKKKSFKDHENYLLTNSLDKQIPIVATNENFYLKKVILTHMMRCLVLLNRNILKVMIDLKAMMNFILKALRNE